MWDNFHKKKKQRTVWEPKRENGMWTDSGRMTSLPERGGGAKDFAYHFKWIVSLQQDSHCCPLWCVSNVLNTFAQRGHFTPLAVVTSQTWLTGIFQPNASGLGQVSKDSSLSATASAYSYVCRQKTGLLLGMSSVWTRSKTWWRWNELTFIRHYQRQNLLPSEHFLRISKHKPLLCWEVLLKTVWVFFQ